MRMYQTSVEYYSAINSPKFEIYTNKIKDLMKTDKINELIDKPEQSSISTEDSNNSKPVSKKGKEEKKIIQGLNKIKNKLNSISGKKENKKVNTPKVKVALSKEDEDGGTLDVGSDDEEEEEEEDEDNNNKENENKNNENIENDKDIKEDKIEEIKNEENSPSENVASNEIKGNSIENKIEEEKTTQ